MENQDQEIKNSTTHDPSAFVKVWDVADFFDEQTKQAQLADLGKVILANNQPLVQQSEENKSIYMCASQDRLWPIVVYHHIENEKPFNMAIALSISGKYKSRTFSFGAFNPQTGMFVVFFQGEGKTQDRDEAIEIFQTLLEYTQTYLPDFIPFAIKLP